MDFQQYRGRIMYFVYALRSLSYNFIYVGMTENLDERVIRHNKGYVKSTKGIHHLNYFIMKPVKKENGLGNGKNILNRLRGRDISGRFLIQKSMQVH